VDLSFRLRSFAKFRNLKGLPFDVLKVFLLVFAAGNIVEEEFVVLVHRKVALTREVI